MPTITFAYHQIAVYRPSARGYDFLEFNQDRHQWITIDAPQIQGIFLNYHQHPLGNTESHLILRKGRSQHGRNINIKITKHIMKLTGRDIWICVLELLSGDSFRSTHTRLMKQNVPILTEQPIDPDLGSQQRSSRPPLHIPTGISELHISLYRAIYNIVSTTAMPDVDINMTVHDLVQIQMTMLLAGLKSKESRRPVPAHIANIIARDAIARNEICPITMDDITEDTYGVTSCFHVFNRDAIAVWLVTNNTCPVCKQECTVTVK